MMDQFWQWFVRLNPRTVFLAAAAGLVLTVFLTVREKPAAAVPPPLSVPGPVTVAVPSAGGVAALPEAGTGPLVRVVSPFTSGYLADFVRKEEEAWLRAEAEKRRAAEEAERLAREKAEAQRKAAEEAERLAREKAEAERKAREAAAKPAAPAAPAAAAAAAPAAPPAPPPPPPPKTVTLVYRGLMQRTDGSVVALVEDAATGEVGVYKRGDRVADMRIDSMVRNELSVTTTNNAVHMLKAGERTTITEKP